MQVAPNTTAAPVRATIDTRHPMEQINVFDKVQRVLGLQSYQVPNTTRETLAAIAPRTVGWFRSKFGGVFDNKTEK